MIKIQELRNLKDNTEVTMLYALVANVTSKTAANGIYLDVDLQDSTGSTVGKVWQATEEQLQVIGGFIGKIVNVTGVKVTYRDQMQLKISNITEADSQAIEMFVESAPVAKHELQESIERYILLIEDPTMQRITRKLISKYSEQFYTHPAASKNHHEYMSGLAYHTDSMLRLADAMATLYPSLNRSYLYAGIILHDLGKVIELSGPVSPTYTTVGKLIGHINIIVSEIHVVAHELGLNSEAENESLMILEHLVLSHHGKYEYGSPKLPMMREAEMIHYIDNIDARMMMLDRALDATSPGEFTPRIFALENRQFYKPKSGE